MNGYYIAAALLAVLVGLIHSVMGERLIFRRLRRHGRAPVPGGDAFRESHLRILWATWHVVTLFGWCIAGVLVRLASSRSDDAVIAGMIAVAMTAGAILVFVATRGRHPGWAGLLGVAALTLLGLYA